MAQFHIHWGDKKTRGAEHVFPDLGDGIRSIAELHMVHVNVRYADLTEAAGKSDGLLVLGIAFEHDETADNAFLQVQ